MTSEVDFESHQADLAYVPIIIRYTQLMPKRPWVVLPGVTLLPTPTPLKEVFNNPAIAKFTFGSGNYTIRVDKKEYLLNAKKRLKQFSKGQSAHFYPQRVAKNLVLSLLLECPNAGIIVGGHFSGHEKDGTFVSTGYANIPSLRKSGHEELASYRVALKAQKRLNRKGVALNFCRLEKYFLSPTKGNVVFLKSDPISVAAQGIWAALGTPFDDQAFITFAMVLEALLTTASTEVTLQIAERAAVLIEKSDSHRREVYRSVKRLYGIRSKLVHGSGILRKKSKEKVNIHPSFNFVPSDELQAIGAIAIRVLRAVLHNDDLYDVVQGKDQSKRDEYYVHKLLS